MPQSPDDPKSQPGSPVGGAPEPEISLRSLKKSPTSKEVKPIQITRRRALLIGVANYDSPHYNRLRFPVEDVRRFRAVLLSYGYTSVECLDDAIADERWKPSLANIKSALKRLCEEAAEDELIWVHFSGHGTRRRVGEKDVRLLITQDTRPSDEVGTALRVEEDIEVLLRQSKARQKVLSLDACYVGAGRDPGTPDSPQQIVYDFGEGIATLAASSSSQVAQESAEDRLGMYTSCLLTVLQTEVTRQKFAALSSIAHGVFAAVVREYKQRDRLPQQPTHYFEGMGELLLVDLRPRGAQGMKHSLSHIEALPVQIPEYTLSTPAIEVNNFRVTYHARHRGQPVIATILSLEFCEEKKLYKNEQKFLDDVIACLLDAGQVPNVAAVRDSGKTSDGRTYFVTAYIPGKRLSKQMKLGCSIKEIINYSSQVANALAVMHAKNVIHGDLSPERILIKNDKEVWLLDFGVAAIEAKLRLLQQPNEERSPYWPPEFVPSSPQHPEHGEGDIFALGKIIEELLGQPGSLSLRDDHPALARLADRMVQGTPSLRPTAAQVAIELKAMLQPSLLPWIGGAAGVCLLGGAAWWFAIHPGPGPSAADLSTPKGGPVIVKVSLPDGSPPIPSPPIAVDPYEEARSVLRKALALRTEPELVLAALRELEWVGDLSFVAELQALLKDSGSTIKVRVAAARALGRGGASEAVKPLRELVADEQLDPALWQESLRVLTQLENPIQVLNGVARPYLGPSSDPVRRETVAALFAPIDPKAQAVLDELHPAGRKEDQDALSIAAEPAVMLARSRSLSESARATLAKLLPSSGLPTEIQATLALSLAAEGDRTGIDVLRRLVTSAKAGGSLGQLQETAQQLLARIDPQSEQCQTFAGAMSGGSPSYTSLMGIHHCPQPEQYIPSLQGLVKKWSGTQAERQLSVHAAAATLRIGSILSPVGRTPPLPQDPRELAKVLAEQKKTQASKEQIALLFANHVKIALNRAETKTRRLRAAEQAARLRPFVPAPYIQDKKSPATPVQVVIQEALQQVGDAKTSTDPIDRLLPLLQETNPAKLADAMKHEKNRDIQLLLAWRVNSPEANQILKQAARGHGVAAMRSYGELLKREQPVRKPGVDPLQQYRTATPDDRVEIINALSGWPFPESKTTLVHATGDGYVEVRRSTVQVIGESTLNKEHELDALSALRLMFADSDWLVHVHLRRILGEKHVSASEAPKAPTWPPPPEEKRFVRPNGKPDDPPPPAPTECTFNFSADDGGVEIEANGQPLTLPASLVSKEFKYSASYLNDRGEPRTVTGKCDPGEAVPVPLPISKEGQLLGRGIRLWKENNSSDAAQKLFSQVQQSAGALAKWTNPDAVSRGRSIVARSYYYLGKILFAKRKNLFAHEQFEKFLSHPGAAQHSDLVQDARTQRAVVEKQLGRFMIRLPVNGRCQEHTRWAEHGEGKSVEIGDREFGNLKIEKERTLEGTHECK